MDLDPQITKESLAALGSEAVSLVCSGDLAALAQRFGYARAFGRDVESAVAEDLNRCLGELGARSVARSAEQPSAVVKYFSPNETGLVALVECYLVTDNDAKVLLEFVVSGKGTARYLSLEDISVA